MSRSAVQVTWTVGRSGDVAPVSTVSVRCFRLPGWAPVEACFCPHRPGHCRLSNTLHAVISRSHLITTRSVGGRYAEGGAVSPRVVVEGEAIC